MTNYKARLILFFFAVPSLFSIFLFLPHFKYLAAIICMSISAVLSSLELRVILAKQGIHVAAFAVFMPGIPPLLSWLVNMEILNGNAISIAFAVGVYLVFIKDIFQFQGSEDKSTYRSNGYLLVLIYPTWFFWWMARLTWFDNAGWIFIIFLATVICNDSLSWLFGVLVGKHKNVFAVSPRKSIEGYLGGMAGTIILLIAVVKLFPWFLPVPFWKIILFGVLIVTATNLGDLFESLLKRYAGMKDSSNIILGRGGILDSIDSWLFAAPVFNIFIDMAT